MFDDMFDTAEELLSGQKEGNVQSFWERLPRNCADGLPMPELQRKKGYPIGLKNQGATCYLNSLLQILFHTPELRRIILELPLCKQTIDKPTDFVSKARQQFLLGFQRLFAEMSLCDQRAVSTDYLKKSFGWDKAEHLQQQDIQQAMRIIFQFFQRALIGTAYQSAIQSLFKGTTIRYKTCRACGDSNDRSEVFYDLQLQVKGATSIEDAIFILTTAEGMEGDNKIFCDVCQSRQDMWLGTRLNQLPGTLVFTLNRFDFDFEKMDRVKINSLFSYNLEQNLSPFLEPNPDQNYNNYELYGVIIHRGSAHGGHYLCYVRDIMQQSDWQAGLKQTLTQQQKLKASAKNQQKQNDKKKQDKQKQYELVEPINKALLQNWFDINDNVATAINAKKLTTKFQGSDSAYILFYRRKSLAVDLTPIQIPSYLSKSLIEANLSLQKQRESYNHQKQHIIINIDGQDRKLKTQMLVSDFIDTFIPNGSALVLQSVHNGLPYYPMQLINCNNQIHTPQATLKSLQIYHESKWKNYIIGTPEYQTIKPTVGKDRLPFELVLLDGQIPKRIICYQDENFLMLRLKIQKMCSIPYQKQILTLVTPYKTTILTDMLQNDDMLLPKLGITHCGQLIIKSINMEEDGNRDVEAKDQTHLLCFLIERDDVIGLKRIYFQKTKTLQQLLDYVCASQSLLDGKRRFRNLNGNRLYYIQHFSKTLSDLELNQEMVKLRLEKGEIPIKGDISIKVKLQSLLFHQEEDKEIALLQKIFDPNTVLTDVKQWACEFYKLDPVMHKLYMTDWMGEPVRSITRQKLTIFQSNFGREQIICLRDINSPIGAELVHLQVFVTKNGSPDSLQKQSIHIKIEEFKTVGELKQLVIASWPIFEGVESSRLRLRQIKRDYMFGCVWRQNNKSVKSVTINSNKIVAQVMKEPESLKQDQIVLIIKKRDPKARSYGQSQQLIFEAGRTPTAEELGLAIKQKVNSQENIKIAKYVHYNFEWVEISRQNIQNLAKGKKNNQKNQKKDKAPKGQKVETKKPQNKEQKCEKIKKQKTQKPPKLQGQSEQKQKNQNQLKKQKKPKGQAQSKPTASEDIQNLRKAPILLKDGDWIGWGPLSILAGDDLQTDEDISLRQMKDNKPVKYKGKDMGGFKLNLQF